MYEVIKNNETLNRSTINTCMTKSVIAYNIMKYV